MFRSEPAEKIRLIVRGALAAGALVAIASPAAALDWGLARASFEAALAGPRSAETAADKALCAAAWDRWTNSVRRGAYRSEIVRALPDELRSEQMPFTLQKWYFEADESAIDAARASVRELHSRAEYSDNVATQRFFSLLGQCWRERGIRSQGS